MTLILDRRGTRTEVKTKTLDKAGQQSIQNTQAVGLTFHERKGLRFKEKQNGRINTGGSQIPWWAAKSPTR